MDILGENKKLKISEVPVECPGLIGPDELTQWCARLNFGDRTCRMDDKRGGMIFTTSGHPRIA